MHPNMAIYPGTFDPVTFGHIDIIERARNIFDLLYVAIGINADKTPLFTTEERLDFLMQATLEMDNVRVMKFDGLLVDMVRNMGANAIVRGIRAVTDFEYEFQVGLLNRDLYENAETVFFIPSMQYIYLNSTVVKAISRNGGSVSKFVPPYVEEALKKRFILKTMFG
jgi:pantetheine-phosphate adenylyltransferase